MEGLQQQISVIQVMILGQASQSQGEEETNPRNLVFYFNSFIVMKFDTIV